MKNIQERILHIRKELASAEKNTDSELYTIKPYREGEYKTVKIKLDANFLRYRIANSRTIIQQLAYKRNHPELGEDLFSDPESNKSQKAQEEILLSMIDRDFKQDLINRTQMDPAIITYDGYIVNGNRRTAALKALNVNYITCVVLPEAANDKDIYELEQELQIAKDFKAPYHWINELKNIREGKLKYDYSIPDMMKRLRINSKIEVEGRLIMMDLIDEFLKWRDLKGQYDYPRLDDTEQVFIELEKAIRSRSFKRYPDKRESLLKLVFSLIEERPETGRLYSHVKNLIKYFDKITQNYSFTEIASEGTNIGQLNLIDQLIDGSENRRIIVGFDNPEESKGKTKEIINIIEDIKSADKEIDNKEAFHNSIKDALRSLQSLSLNNDSTLIIESQALLKEIVKKASELIGAIEKIKNEKS